MVNVQVWWKDANDGGKIASYPCGEADVTGIVADFEAEYGAVKQIVVDDGDVCNKKGNPQYRFHFFAEKHYLLVTVTKKQFERLFDKIVTDDFENKISETYGVMDRIFDRKTGDEKMTENMGYDRDIVLLETGEFKVDGETFTYEGEPITVGDVLDTTRVAFDVVGRDYKGRFLLLSTGHILCRCSHYSLMLNHTTTYDEIVYAPTFEDMYETASDFVESRIELLQRYQPTKEFQKKVNYCSYKGRLFKDLVAMSEAELEAIDNEEPSAEIPIDDVKSYVRWLNKQGRDPKTWAEGVKITEENIDYHIRNQIKWGIDDCEKYCSPSLAFFRLAEQLYAQVRWLVCDDIRENF